MKIWALFRFVGNESAMAKAFIPLALRIMRHKRSFFKLIVELIIIRVAFGK